MRENYNKGFGCLAAVLLAVFFIVIVFSGDAEDPPVPQIPNLATEVTEESLPDLNIPDFNDPDTTVSPLEPFTYPLSAVSALDGIFRLNQAREELVLFSDNLRSFGSSESFWAGPGTVGSGLYLPVTVDRYNGDSLILAGREWDNRSQDQKDSMTIDLYPAALLGYGSQFLYDSVEVGNIDTVDGISIAGVNHDPEGINDALQGTGIRCLHCKRKNNGRYEDRYHLLADSYERAMGYGFYEDTQYTGTSESMIHPYFAYREDAPITAAVQVTLDGYYIIDISTLAPGTYVIDGLAGNHALIII